jgi:DNA polymerase-1
MTRAENNRIFLLDAYALIFRAYYAFIRNPIYNSRGQNSSAIFGFITSLEDLLVREKPSHIAVVFDPPGGTFRHKMYPEYKANREATPEDIKLAVPYIKRLIEAYNIPVIEIPQYEADDVIGTLATKASEEGYTTYMMTPDKDFAQLVGENIYIYKPARSGNEPEVWGVEEVKKNFGVEKPEQVQDILALWGDASDNIPGCPGIGEKTSKKLIQDYHSIEGVFQHLDNLKGKMKESLSNSIEQVRLSKVLATIKTDVPIELDMNSFKMDPPDTGALKNVFEELGFKTLATRVFNRIKQQEKEDQGIAPVTMEDSIKELNLFPADSRLKDIQSIHVNYQLVDIPKSLQELAGVLGKQTEFCFDTETTGIDAMNAEMVCITLSFLQGEAYYVPVPANMNEAIAFLAPLKKVFENEKLGKIGQNLKFDIQILRNYHIEVKGPLFDTMLAHYLIQPELRHNLTFLSETYLGYKPIPIESLIGEKGRGQKTMRDVPREKILDYACEDADVTFQLKNILAVELEKNGMMDLAMKVEMPLIRVLNDMESTGVRIETGVLEQFSRELQSDILEKEENIYRLASTRFNISSPRQLGEILFEKMEIIKDPPKTKTGQYSTGEEVLVDLVDKHVIIQEILDHRSMTKLLTTYVETLPKLINPRTGRVHTSFNQAVTSTGRLSSTNPNLQNIPIREERGREIRKAFIAADDQHVLLSADYSQIELRLMAHMSEDPAMIDAFLRAEDIHTATASKIFNVSLAEVTREMRGRAKTANFGIIYGISAFGLSQRLRISRAEAKELIEGYFRTYPGVRKYMEKTIQEARDKGYVSTLLGRRRYLPDIHSKNAVVRGFAERNAINAPIQGSAADIIKIAMVNIHHKMTKASFGSRMILQVHDELVFDVSLSEKELITSLVKEEMESAIKLKVPLITETGLGKNWLDAH